MVVPARRIDRFDTANAVLMVRVILLHSLVTFCPGPYPIREAGRFVILCCSMVVFMFLSGWFFHRNAFLKKFCHFSFLFLICNTVGNTVVSLVYKTPFCLFKVAPGMWYMLALLVFPLVFAVWPSKKQAFLIPLAFLISWLACFFPADAASSPVGRLFGFAPFFALGHFVGHSPKTNAWRIWLTSTENKAWYLTFLALVYLSGVFFALSGTLPGFLTRGVSFNTFGGGIRECLVRMGFQVLTLVMECAFLKALPESPSRISRLGSRTLPVYLLHLYVVIPVGAFVATHETLHHPWFVRYSVMLGAAVFCLVFFHPLFSRILAFPGCVSIDLTKRSGFPRIKITI